MASTFHIKIKLPEESATTQLGSDLSAVLKAGDVVLLDGDLGSGKTHLARAIIQSRQADAGLPHEDVPSPTFTLVQTYDLGDVEIWHSDLYRLSGPDEIVELGLDDAFETAIVLIEWPDRLAEATPKNSLKISLSYSEDDGRFAEFVGDASWRDRLCALEAWL